IGGLGALQNFVHISSSAPVPVGTIHAVGHEPPDFYAFCPFIHHWKTALYREFGNVFVTRSKNGARQLNQHCLSPPFCGGMKCGLKILRTSEIDMLNLHPERFGGEVDLLQNLGVVAAAWTREERDTREFGNGFLEKLQPLAA